MSQSGNNTGRKSPALGVPASPMVKVQVSYKILTGLKAPLYTLAKTAAPTIQGLLANYYSNIEFYPGFTVPLTFVHGTPSRSERKNLFADSASAPTWIQDSSPKPYDSQTHKFQHTYGDGRILRGHKVPEAKLTLLGDSTDTATHVPVIVGSLYAIGSDGVATRVTEMGDGMLGLAPASTSSGYLKTLHWDPATSKNVVDESDKNTLETLMSSLALDEKKPKIQSYYLTPFAVAADAKMIFGGAFADGAVGDITYIPVKDKTSGKWHVESKLRYGTNNNLGRATKMKVLLDTGYPYLGLPQDMFNAYMTATGGRLKEGKKANEEGYKPKTLVFTKAQFESLQSIHLFIKTGVEIELIPDALIWPRSETSKTEDFDDADYVSIVEPIQTDYMIYGMAVHQRCLVVIDEVNKPNRAGFAKTKYTGEKYNASLGSRSPSRAASPGPSGQTRRTPPTPGSTETTPPPAAKKSRRDSTSGKS